MLCLAAPALMAAETAAEATPSVTFDRALTTAMIALITALTTWFGTRGHEERKAEMKLKVEQDRMPPLGEDVARTYATKKELGAVETKLSGEVRDLRTQIDQNDSKAESRAIGTHARIDTLGSLVMKTNKALGILVGMMCVINKINPQDINTED